MANRRFKKKNFYIYMYNIYMSKLFQVCYYSNILYLVGNAALGFGLAK